MPGSPFKQPARPSFGKPSMRKPKSPSAATRSLGAKGMPGVTGGDGRGRTKAPHVRLGKIVRTPKSSGPKRATSSVRQGVDLSRAFGAKSGRRRGR